MVKKNGPVKPCQPIDNCPCPPEPKITPLVSVRSVNGKNGDVMLNKLTVGEKEYNGTSGVELNAHDVGLQELFTVTNPIGNITAGEELSTGTPVEEILRRILSAPGKVLTSISITTPPTKTSYIVGETFNPAGMVVTATYSSGSPAVVTNYTYTPSTALTEQDTKVTISYVEGGVTKTAEQAITVAGQGVNIYKGICNTVPITQAQIEALTLDSSKSKSALLSDDGYLFKNITTNNQFAVLAIPKSVGINCYEIKVAGFSMGFNTKEIGDYYLYHFDNPTTESSVRYTYLFEEE